MYIKYFFTLLNLNNFHALEESAFLLAKCSRSCIAGQDILRGSQRCVGVSFVWSLIVNCNCEPSFFSVVYDLDFSGVGGWNSFVDMISRFVDDLFSFVTSIR